MSATIPLTEIRGEVAADHPSGDNLEYDVRFQDLIRLADGTREQQYGSTLIAAKPPEWKAMLPLLQELCLETRDLRLGVLLVETATHFDGFAGLAESLDLLKRWVCDFWNSVYPELDPEDANDPFIRVNALSRLSEESRLPTQILDLPLADCPPHTTVTLRDIEHLRGNAGGDAKAHAHRLTATEIEAALMGAEVSQLRTTYDACQSAAQSLTQIITAIEERAPTSDWDATSLRKKLRDCGDVLKHHLRSRMSAADSALEQVSGGTESGDAVSKSQGERSAFSENADPLLTLEIVSREHAAEVVQRVIDFFESHEPSSPVPLILRRAKRLINQNFVEILRDVAPDGLNQLQSLAGSVDEHSS